jgi:oligopeptide transport system substrate-binding protein
MFSLCYSCSTVENRNERKVFRYNEDANVTTLDPAFVKSQSENWVVSQLFNGLIELDNNLIATPSISKSWTISEDGKQYTFTLKDSIFFHPHPSFKSNGNRRVTAHDFVYSFYRIIDPKTASPGSWIFNDKVKKPESFSDIEPDSLNAFIALNDSTFQINLIKPFPPFLSLLSMPYCYVVPKDVVEERKENFRAEPVGTGPFKFKLWEENVKLILLKNEMYFEKENGTSLPHLDAVNIDFIQNKQLAFMNFIQGKYDFFNGIDASYKDELLTKSGNLSRKYENKFKLEKKPFLNTEYIGIILESDENPKLNEKKVRQALNLAIDRERMINHLRNGIGQVANGGFIPNGLPGNILGDGYTYDKEKALRLLTEADYNSNSDLIVINTTKDYLAMSIYIKKEWEKVGVESTIEVHPSGYLRQLRNKMEIKVFRGSWIADYADAENYLACFYSGNFSPSGPNYCHFKNDKFDSLYVQSQYTTEESEKVSLYRQMDSLLVEDAPIIFLYYDYSIRLMGNHVKGLVNSPANALRLKTVYFE